jgi:hypothetical protein
MRVIASSSCSDIHAVFNALNAMPHDACLSHSGARVRQIERESSYASFYEEY